MVKLEAICRIIVDGDWIESKDQSECGIRLIQTGNIGIGEYLNKCNRAKYISAETFERLKCTEVLTGDILISRLPDPVGRACAVPQYVGKAIAAVDCTIVRLDNTLCDANYFINYTQSVRYGNELSKFLAGTTRTRISRKNLEKIEIPLPPLDKQRKIAAVLDKVSSLITKRRQQLDKLDEMVKARFVEMFGDPITNPKHWSLQSLSSICKDIYGGGTPSKSHPEYFAGNIPWVSPKDMKSDVILDSVDHITEEAVQNSSTKMVPKNAVLMVIRSGILKHTLPVAIAAVELTVNQDMKVFVAGEDITSKFLMYYFKAIEADVLSGVRGVTADNIDFKEFQKRLVIVPPIELQNQFSAFVEQTEKTKTTISRSLEKLETLKKALMQEYFG